MCVSRREATLWVVRPRSFSPARSDPSVDSGPGSMIADSLADSIKSAAIDCGLPVQFRSIVVKVVIVSVVYQFSREHLPGLGKSCRCKDLLAESWELGIRYWHRALSFLMMSRPEKF